MHQYESLYDTEIMATRFSHNTTNMILGVIEGCGGINWVRYMPWWGTYRPYATFPPVKLETTRKHCTHDEACTGAGGWR